MNLTLVTPPTAAVVSGPELCAWLRVTEYDEQAVLESLEASAVAHLDGWRGVLGRAIRSQTWRQEFTGWGELLLAMPDVVSITVTGLDAAGAPVVATRAELRSDICGPYVITEGPEVDRVFVEFVCAMPESQLPVVKTIVKLIVAHWFRNRETASDVALTEMPLGAQALIHSTRWTRI